MVEQIRHFAPRVVILPFPVGRHPDHRIASELGRDACFLAGLAKYDAPGAPHRPHKILYALSYREDPVKPTFVVDISAAVRAEAGRHPVLRQPVRRRQGGRGDLPDRPGPLLPGRDPERPLRLADPHPLRRAVLHPRDRWPVDDVVTLGVQSM